MKNQLWVVLNLAGTAVYAAEDSRDVNEWLETHPTTGEIWKGQIFQSGFYDLQEKVVNIRPS